MIIALPILESPTTDMSLFSSEPLAEGEPDQPYHAALIPSSPMSLSNFEDTEGFDIMDRTMAPAGSSSSPTVSSSSTHKEQLLKIINDPTSNSQVRLTYNVAQEMNSRKLWRFYLTDEEHAIFEAALTSLDTWRSFISLDHAFETRLEEINRQQELEKELQQEQQPQSQPFEGIQPDSIPEVELSTEVIEASDAGMGGSGGSGDRLPDIVKVEAVDQDLLSSDLMSSVLKKEDSFSARSSPAVSTPPVSTPNGHLRTPLTPNHREGSLSPRRNRDSVPPNSSTKPEASIADSSSVSEESHSIPPSIPTTAFRSRVMVFEQLLPKLYPGHGGCCHPTIDISELDKKEVSSNASGEIRNPKVVVSSVVGSRRNLEDDDYDGDMDTESNKDGTTNEPNKGVTTTAPKDIQSKDASMPPPPFFLSVLLNVLVHTRDGCGVLTVFWVRPVVVLQW